LIIPYLDFEWWKDARGYRLAEAEKPGPKQLAWQKKHPRFITLEPFRSYQLMGRVVRLGGKQTPYHPLDRSETDNLAIIFANKARSAEGVLYFIKTFGPLTELGLDETLGEPVSAVIEQAKAMHTLVTAPVKNKKHGATLIGRHSMEFSFTLDPLTETPRLRYQPKDLLGALWLQLGQHLMGGGTVKVCRQCGILFPAGPGTRRREDAEFCSDDHRTKYHNQNRGKEK
jgi:hypothetical protein